jgi:CRP-like cAMP-binding protein
MIDIDKLKDKLPFLVELNAGDVFDFLKQVKIIQLSPGEIFLEAGSIKSHIYFINRGLVRSYFIDEKGQEITNRLRYENQLVAAYEIIIFGQPARFSFQALEPAELFVIDFDDMRRIVNQNAKLEPGRRYFVMNMLAETLSALDDFILLSPEQRYLKFMQEHPDLLNRVPNKYIANVLGITPVSLSRIRKRVASKKQ